MVTTKMSIASRKESLSRLKPRYLKADKKSKSGMLGEFCQNTGYNRKYAVRILSPSHEYRLKVINRQSHYTYTNEDIFLAQEDLGNHGLCLWPKTGTAVSRDY